MRRNAVNTRDHWNRIYTTQQYDKVGWYEQEPTPSLELISRCRLGPTDPMIDVGAGSTTLIDHLLGVGYKNLYVLDHSEVALDVLYSRLPRDQRKYVTVIEADILNEEWIAQVGEVSLWHDRALLHFFVDPEDREAYAASLNRVVRVGGFAIISAFSLEGADRCSGLAVHRYSLETLAELVGKNFLLEDGFDYAYRMPSGDIRPYIYALFKKKS
ncbi:MAG: SAM-dependent methyltransferase [Anaerolineales bacterium]|nr:SAM-dependent methyltransferase [Anaerolineales bacterium]